MDYEFFPLTENLELDLLKAFRQDRILWNDFKDHIDPNYFKDDNITKIFNIFSKYFEKYRAMPDHEQCKNISQIKKYDESIYKTLDNIFDNRNVASDKISYLRDECKKFIKENKIKRAVLKSIDLLEQNNYLEIETVVKEAVNWDNSLKLGTDISNVEERFLKLQELTSNVIPSPWSAMNSTIGGGFYAKELFLFVAASSVGKSIALDNCATHSFLRNKNVAVITLELSEERKAQRMDAEMHNIDVSEVIYHKDKITEFYLKNHRENRMFIKEFPTSSISIRHIEQYLYQLDLYEGFIPDILFVDYLEILKGSKHTYDEYVDQGTIGNDLRAYAQEKVIPVVSATQTNRGAINIPIEELTEANIGDSINKMRIADTIVALGGKPEERAIGRINFKNIKARNGVKDIAYPMKIEYSKLKIVDACKN